jgi:hypothetical protein
MAHLRINTQLSSLPEHINVELKERQNLPGDIVKLWLLPQTTKKQLSLLKDIINPC